MRSYFYTNSVSKQAFTYQEVGRFNFPHGEPALCSHYSRPFLSAEQKDISEAPAPSEGALRNGARTKRGLFCSTKGRASAVRGEIFFSVHPLSWFPSGRLRRGSDGSEFPSEHRVSFACCRSTELLRAGLRGYCEGVWRRGQDITWTFSSYMMGQSGNRISSSRKSTENKRKWSH